MNRPTSNENPARSADQAQLPFDIVLMMGVSGCGKTTVAERLSRLLDGPMIEADDLHPAENVERMRSGVPLTDLEREPWLAAINATAHQAKALGNGPVVVACSALRRKYRDLLFAGFCHPVIIHITGSEQLLRTRLEARRNHFMPASLLESQLATLEPIQDDEVGFTLDLALPAADMAHRAAEQLKHLGLVSAQGQPRERNQ